MEARGQPSVDQMLGWVMDTGDADLELWPTSVMKLERFAFDFLVPGHGDRLDPGLLKDTLGILTTQQD